MKIKITYTFLILITVLVSNLFAAQFYKDAYFEEQTVEGEAVFSGNITIKGRLTVREGSLLTILGGTKLTFLYLDEDGDGIGESEILSQGVIKVLGTNDSPVIFNSNVKKQGAWLGFSIMSVDEESVIQNAVFEDAYMALHSHFSKLRVTESVFRNNFRGFQSQEGLITLISNEFYNNNTGVQFRNSNSTLEGNKIHNNEGGLNFLYSNVVMRDCVIEDNVIFGIKVRFSKADVNNVTVSKSLQNFYGKNSEVKLNRVISKAALMRGFSFEDSQIMMIDCNANDNLLDGISLDSSLLECDNTKFANNGRFHVYLKGKSNISGSYKSDRNNNVLFIEQ